jgi:hypothetical protein
MFKLEVEKDGEFVTVYTRNLSTGVEVGGTITGEETDKVSDTKFLSEVATPQELIFPFWFPPRGASSGKPIIFEGV